MAETSSNSNVPVKTLLQRFEESKNYRKNYEDDWDKNRQMYEGDQWEGVAKVAWFQSEPVYNKIFEFVELHRAYLSDSKWGVDVIPASMPKKMLNEARKLDPLVETQEVVGITDDILDISDKVNKLLDFLWTQNRTSSKLAEVILYMFLYGTGFMKATFDVEDVGDSGIGQIETKVLSPWYIFPDPAATSVHDASYIIEHHPVTYRWIIERYPDKAEEVKNAGLSSTSEYNERKGSKGRGAIDTQDGKYVDVYECWYTDSTITEDEPATAAYPSGRMSFITSTGVVLEDKPNPYGMWPYVRYVEIPRPAEFFGDCTVSKLTGIQESINTVLRTIIDNGLWLVHGIWIADTTSGIDPDSMAGYAPRDVIVKNPGTEVRRDAGEQLPQHLFALLEQQVDAFDRIAGTEAALRGVVPSRQPVATTEMQMEAANTRTRERQRRVEESLEDLGKLWLDIASEHWNDKRVIRNKRMLGGFDMFEMNKKDLAEWKFDVFVIPGSTSPMDAQNKLQQAFELIDRGGIQIPPSYLIELSGLPGLQAAMMEQMNEMPDEEVDEQVDVGGDQPMEPLPELPPELPMDIPPDAGLPMPPLDEMGQPPLI